MTDVKLPPVPQGKYQWWDDYYEGLTLSETPEDRYHQLGLYDQDQMEEYARLAVLKERERCAKICDSLQNLYDDDVGFDRGYSMCAERAADAIRKGAP